ncbi:MAG: hypothetical protein ACE5G0_15765 [Rhodothermales bacterium]
MPQEHRHPHASFDASALPSAVYLYRLTAEPFAHKLMTLLK